jgi:serine/threonine protein kinase
MNPGENLVGQVVNGEWIVEAKVDLSEARSTGGFFSIPYAVRHKETGQRAFLKLLDVVKAIQRYTDHGLSLAETLNRITSGHLFEVHLMETCGARRLSRVVRALDHGEVNLDVPFFGTIAFPFLVFELGDGDTHKLLTTMSRVDQAWWFHTLHQVATGLKQLHGIEIAHQDVKGSNVVFFGAANAKLADLGRAVQKGKQSLNDQRAIRGDGTHAPPEYHYGYTPPDWDERHLATDLYLLGSLAFAFYSGVSMTLALFAQLPPELLPTHIGIKFNEALPALIHAFGSTLQALGKSVDPVLREKLIPTIRYLCHPDPSLRGHPKDHEMLHGNRFSVERFISAFHRLAVTAQTQLK